MSGRRVSGARRRPRAAVRSGSAPLLPQRQGGRLGVGLLVPLHDAVLPLQLRELPLELLCARGKHGHNRNAWSASARIRARSGTAQHRSTTVGRGGRGAPSRCAISGPGLAPLDGRQATARSLGALWGAPTSYSRLARNDTGIPRDDRSIFVMRGKRRTSFAQHQPAPAPKPKASELPAASPRCGCSRPFCSRLPCRPQSQSRPTARTRFVHASVWMEEREGEREKRCQQFTVHSNHPQRCLLSVACFRVQRAVAWIIRGQTRSKTGMVSSGALTILVTPPTTTSVGSKRFFQLAPLGNTTLRFVAPCVVTGATRYFGPSVY